MSLADRVVAGLDANRTVKDELTDAFTRQGRRRRISVTDLVNPRQAYFQRAHPEIQPDPERKQAMLAGTGFHEVFGRAVSTEEFVEQFVEFQGIVGKIDIYEEVPVELKTTASLPSGLAAARASYLDQLGMYCTMTGRDEGRLFVYKRALYGRPGEMRAFDVRFRDLRGVEHEMVRRRDLFRHALEHQDPSGLPRCEWFDLRCDFRPVCGCETAELLTRVVPGPQVQIVENGALVAALAPALAAGPFAGGGEDRQDAGPRFGLNDLVFPRKTAVRRQAVAEGQPEDEDADLDTSLAGLERLGFGDALKDALWYGVPGAFARVPVSLRGLKGKVGTFRGVPTIIRSTKKARMVDRPNLVEEFPYYFDRIAFECALSGKETGRVVIYYESVKDDKFMVYDVHFRNLAEILAEADRRLALLESGAPPDRLPACEPGWMPNYCSLGARCACRAPSL
jgi:antitoxin (DNA-binding transcriptional repressor) of toxin-antitoxin stability system